MIWAFVRIVVLHSDRRTGVLYLAPWLADLIVLAAVIWVVVVLAMILFRIAAR